MKKLYILVITFILFVSGCNSSATQVVPTQPSATKTPRATETSFSSPTASLTPSPTPIPQSMGLPDGTIPDGLGVSIHYYYVGPSYLPQDQFILLRDANLGFIRDNITPGSSCYTPPWCFGDADAIVQVASELNLRVIFILSHQDSRALITPEDRQAYAGFARDAVIHFKGKGVIWELWGEPNGDWAWAPKNDPQQYALLASETIIAMREADPDAIIIGPNLASLDTIFGDDSWKYLQAVGELGLLPQFDAVNIHFHTGKTPESQVGLLLRLRRLVDSFSPDRKIPITSSEWGYTNGGRFYNLQVTPEQQAQYLVRSWLVNLSHEINLSIWYDWKDEDANVPLEEYDKYFGILTYSGDQKPVYSALKTLTTTLDGYQFIRRITTDSDKDYLLMFRKENSDVLVAWTINSPHRLTIPNVIRDIQAVDMSGISEILPINEQGLALSLTGSPQYLFLTESSLGEETIYWKPEGTFFRLDNTNHGEVPVTIENPSEQERTYGLQASLNDENMGNLQVVVGPHETRTVHLPVNMKTRSTKVDFLVEITMTSQETTQTAWVWLQK